MPDDRRTRAQLLEELEALRHSEQQYRLLAELHQSQKMEAIGRLAGGVAHDFNNLLTAINGYAEMILSSLRDDDPMRADLEEIRKAGTRASQLTAQLLTFSRKQVIKPRVLELNQVIDQSVRMLRRIIGEDIQLRFIPEKNLWRILSDPGQMDQLLFNLATNARDAMPQGGTLTIETQNLILDEPFCRRYPGADPGDYILLVVSDTGHGMDSQTLEHIFEPFYSTKDKGSGLGLSLVYGVVRQNQGVITAYSEPGVGSTFKIYLPRVMVEAEDRPRSSVATLPFGEETVLVVEDEEMVRRLSCKILQQHGYRVLDAEVGKSALALSDQFDGEIHLLLTDMVMPMMNGRELYEKLKKRRPSIRALFMSGYTANVMVVHGVLDEGAEFIQKPFTIDALVRKVREVLDLKPSG